LLNPVSAFVVRMLDKSLQESIKGAVTPELRLYDVLGETFIFFHHFEKEWNGFYIISVSHHHRFHIFLHVYKSSTKISCTVSNVPRMTLNFISFF
jgi:hypothetical protein